jgi:hypothetical protein
MENRGERTLETNKKKLPLPPLSALKDGWRGRGEDNG